METKTWVTATITCERNCFEATIDKLVSEGWNATNILPNLLENGRVEFKMLRDLEIKK